MAKITRQNTADAKPSAATVPRPTLPKHIRVANNVRKSCGRMTKLTAFVEALGPEAEDATLCMRGAVDAIAEAIGHIEGLPADFVAPRKARTTAQLEIGTSVQLRDGKRAEYEGLLTAAEMGSLTVMALNGRRVICQTSAGAKLFLPRAALKLA